MRAARRAAKAQVNPSLGPAAVSGLLVVNPPGHADEDGTPLSWEILNGTYDPASGKYYAPTNVWAAGAIERQRECPATPSTMSSASRCGSNPNRGGSSTGFCLADAISYYEVTTGRTNLPLRYARATFRRLFGPDPTFKRAFERLPLVGFTFDGIHVFTRYGQAPSCVVHMEARPASVVQHATHATAYDPLKHRPLAFDGADQSTIAGPADKIPGVPSQLTRFARDYLKGYEDAEIRDVLGLIARVRVQRGTHDTEWAALTGVSRLDKAASTWMRQLQERTRRAYNATQRNEPRTIAADPCAAFHTRPAAKADGMRDLVKDAPRRSFLAKSLAELPRTLPKATTAQWLAVDTPAGQGVRAAPDGQANGSVLSAEKAMAQKQARSMVYAVTEPHTLLQLDDPGLAIYDGRAPAGPIYTKIPVESLRTRKLHLDEAIPAPFSNDLPGAINAVPAAVTDGLLVVTAMGDPDYLQTALAIAEKRWQKGRQRTAIISAVRDTRLVRFMASGVPSATATLPSFGAPEATVDRDGTVVRLATQEITIAAVDLAVLAEAHTQASRANIHVLDTQSIDVWAWGRPPSYGLGSLKFKSAAAGAALAAAVAAAADMGLADHHGSAPDTTAEPAGPGRDAKTRLHVTFADATVATVKPTPSSERSAAAATPVRQPTTAPPPDPRPGTVPARPQPLRAQRAWRPGARERAYIARGPDGLIAYDMLKRGMILWDVPLRLSGAGSQLETAKALDGADAGRPTPSYRPPRPPVSLAVRVGREGSSRSAYAGWEAWACVGGAVVSAAAAPAVPLALTAAAVATWSVAAIAHAATAAAPHTTVAPRRPPLPDDHVNAMLDHYDPEDYYCLRALFADTDGPTAPIQERRATLIELAGSHLGHPPRSKPGTGACETAHVARGLQPLKMDNAPPLGAAGSADATIHPGCPTPAGHHATDAVLAEADRSRAYQNAADAHDAGVWDILAASAAQPLLSASSHVAAGPKGVYASHTLGRALAAAGPGSVSLCVEVAAAVWSRMLTVLGATGLEAIPANQLMTARLAAHRAGIKLNRSMGEQTQILPFTRYAMYHLKARYAAIGSETEAALERAGYVTAVETAGGHIFRAAGARLALALHDIRVAVSACACSPGPGRHATSAREAYEPTPVFAQCPARVSLTAIPGVPVLRTRQVDLLRIPGPPTYQVAPSVFDPDQGTTHAINPLDANPFKPCAYIADFTEFGLDRVPDLPLGHTHLATHPIGPIFPEARAGVQAGCDNALLDGIVNRMLKGVSRSSEADPDAVSEMGDVLMAEVERRLDLIDTAEVRMKTIPEWIRESGSAQGFKYDQRRMAFAAGEVHFSARRPGKVFTKTQEFQGSVFEHADACELKTQRIICDRAVDNKIAAKGVAGLVTTLLALVFPEYPKGSPAVFDRAMTAHLRAYGVPDRPLAIETDYVKMDSSFSPAVIWQLQRVATRLLKWAEPFVPNDDASDRIAEFLADLHDTVWSCWELKPVPSVVLVTFGLNLSGDDLTTFYATLTSIARGLVAERRLDARIPNWRPPFEGLTPRARFTGSDIFRAASGDDGLAFGQCDLAALLEEELAVARDLGFQVDGKLADLTGPSSRATFCSRIIIVLPDQDGQQLEVVSPRKPARIFARAGSAALRAGLSANKARGLLLAKMLSELAMAATPNDGCTPVVVGLINAVLGSAYLQKAKPYVTRSQARSAAFALGLAPGDGSSAKAVVARLSAMTRRAKLPSRRYREALDELLGMSPEQQMAEEANLMALLADDARRVVASPGLSLLLQRDDLL